MSIEFLPGGGSGGSGGAEQDTGWRVILRDDAYIYVRRIGVACYGRFNLGLNAPSISFDTNLGVGWRPAVRSNAPYATGGTAHTAYFDADDDVLYDDDTFPVDPIDVSMVWLSKDPFPSEPYSGDPFP